MARSESKAAGTSAGRRNFLLAMGAGGAATVAAIAAKTQTIPTPIKTSAGKRSTKGYTVSEHINNYYRTTKV
ncbi:MAG: hypothetical protein ABI630_00960 [Betaproteobacteria bacterium]